MSVSIIERINVLQLERTRLYQGELSAMGLERIHAIDSELEGLWRQRRCELYSAHEYGKTVTPKSRIKTDYWAKIREKS